MTNIIMYLIGCLNTDLEPLEGMASIPHTLSLLVTLYNTFNLGVSLYKCQAVLTD